MAVAVLRAGGVGSCETRGRGWRRGVTGRRSEVTPGEFSLKVAQVPDDPLVLWKETLTALHTSLSTDTHTRLTCAWRRLVSEKQSWGGTHGRGAAGGCRAVSWASRLVPRHGGDQRRQSSNTAGRRGERLTAHGYKTPANG